MTSEERREARYRRRKAKRAENKARALETADNFDKAFTYKHLYKSYRKCRRGVSWKSSVQRYSCIAPLAVRRTYRQLKRGTYRSPGFFEFDLYERGKKRHIRSTVIGERVVQRCLCDYCLVPALTRTFIYDNGASMKNKGYHFALDRLERALKKHYRKHGNKGYILLYDFSKFFDNVSHRLVKSIVRKELTDRRLIKLTDHFIDMFGAVGLGLGSQISQILALASANQLDHKITELEEIGSYGRYMDDGQMISDSKEKLKRTLATIKQKCEEDEIKLNKKKTHIVKLSHGFIWLQAKFYLNEKGRVVRKIPRKSVTRERKKLKKLYALNRDGRIKYRTLYTSFQSWRGYAGHFTAQKTVQSMRRLYNQLLSASEREDDYVLYQN